MKVHVTSVSKLGINLNRGAGNLASMAMLGQCQCYCPAMPGNVPGAESREQGGSNNISCSLGA